MSIAKPFTFVANTYAKASEVNANFDTVYSQVNSNISAIAQNATDIDNLENNKADINGNTAQRFAVADAITNGDAINKQTLFRSIGNSIDYISGFTITKDSGSPDDTIIVSAGSCYDSTKVAVLSLSSSITKQNLNQGASATYYVYVIGNSTGSSVDVLISTSSTSPALPSGYALYRLIGNYTTDADSKISIINSFGFNSNIPSPTSVVVESYVNGKSWYRVYSDGWCEQGGEFLASYNGVTTNFLKPFKDINYYINANQPLRRGGYQPTNGITDKTKTYFTSTSSSESGGAGESWNVTWMACGYIN